MPTTNGFINMEGKSDVYITVKSLMDATLRLTKHPSSIAVIHEIESIVAHLKQLLEREKREFSSYAVSMHHRSPSSERRKKHYQLSNLIQYIEIQAERVENALNPKKRSHGLHYYVATISNVVLGVGGVAQIGRSMESRLQSWLDQQEVRDLIQLIVEGCGSNNNSDERIISAISSFEYSIKKGFDSSLQDTILSSGLVHTLVALFDPTLVVTMPLRVQKQAAFALLALLEFNKDVFVSLVLMSKLVENLIGLLDLARTRLEKDVLLELMLIFKGFLSAGEAVFIDKVYSENGIPRFVEILDHKSQALRHVAMECVMELAYHGRMEVIEKMLELEVIKKLASLQKTNAYVVDAQYSSCEMLTQQERGQSLHSQDNHFVINYSFADTLAKFTLNFAIGTGLRKRERCALKREVIKQITEILDDHVELANITAEILWAP